MSAVNALNSVGVLSGDPAPLPPVVLVSFLEASSSDFSDSDFFSNQSSNFSLVLFSESLLSNSDSSTFLPNGSGL